MIIDDIVCVSSISTYKGADQEAREKWEDEEGGDRNHPIHQVSSKKLQNWFTDALVILDMLQ